MTSILPRTPGLQIGAAIVSATEYLHQYDLGFGHGTGSASDDAAWLVLECAGLSPIEEPDYSATISAEAIERCEILLRKRAEDKIPVAYLVGRTWFAGLEFMADRRALIPRSPLAELIQNEFRGLIDTSLPFTVLDLCTGGGCIGLAIAKLLPQASVVASDISDAALALARSNRAAHQLANRVTLVESDLFSDITGRFDLIISNPPYVNAADIDDMSDEFRSEPALGLASGHDGLDITRRILACAADYLTEDGILVVEVGNSADALLLSYPNLPFIWLDFANGGDGVFALSYRDLCNSPTAQPTANL